MTITEMLDRDDVLILDTETTGFAKWSEIVEISIIDTTGTVRLDTVVMPRGNVPQAVVDVHGLSKEHLAALNAPPWSRVSEEVQSILSQATVLAAYNIDFDLRMIEQSNRRHRTTFDPDFSMPKTWCILREYERYAYGVTHGSGPAKLADACHSLTGALPDPDHRHRSLGDCMTTLSVMRALADRYHQSAISHSVTLAETVEYAPPSGGSTVAGQRFVITGEFDEMSRPELERLIERCGGKVTGSVSGRTNYLVRGYGRFGTKAKAAAEKGVAEIGIVALLDMLGCPEFAAAPSNVTRVTRTPTREDRPPSVHLLSASGVQSAQRSYELRGIRTWHVFGSESPHPVRDLGQAVVSRAVRPVWIDRIVAAGEDFDLVRWDAKGGGLLALHAPATPQDQDRMSEFVVGIKRIAAVDSEAKREHRARLHEAQDGFCAVCGIRIESRDCIVDYLVHPTWGGENSMDNMLAACPDCRSNRRDTKREMLFSWAHFAGLWDAGWTPLDLSLPGVAAEIAWPQVRPDDVLEALVRGPVKVPKEGDRRKRRLLEVARALEIKRTKRAGSSYIPASQRENPWDHWPDIIRNDPLRFAGMDDYRFLAELGSPILCHQGSNCTPGCKGRCEANDPKRRSSLRERLHRILKQQGWSHHRVPPGYTIVMGDPEDQPTYVPMHQATVEIGSTLPAPSSATVLSGLRIAVTGKFEIASRSEFEQLIERGGGTVAKKVSRTTDRLLAGENAGSKLSKARKLGIPIITIDQFLDLIEA